MPRALAVALALGRVLHLLAGVFAFAIIFSRTAVAARPPQFNIILLSLDTLAADHMSVYGYSRDTTPFMAKLARESVVFDDAISQAAWTLPSHYSLFTGVYPETHKFVGGEMRNPLALDPRFKTVAEAAKERGYYTVWGGTSTTVPTLAYSRGLGRGFDESNELDLGRPGIPEARQLLAGLAKKRFFLFLHTYRVHAPYFPDEWYRELFESAEGLRSRPSELLRMSGTPGMSSGRSAVIIAANFFNQFDPEDPVSRRKLAGQYDGGVRSVDDRVAEIVEELKRLGIYDSTLLLITSDHGESFGEHGHFGHLRPNREELHVPLIMKLPKQIRGIKPRHIREQTLEIDVLPTLLELMGAPASSVSEGQSLVPLMRGKPLVREGYIFAHGTGPRTLAVWDREWKLVAGGGPGDVPMAKFPARNTDRLYRIASDPKELHDVAAGNPDVANRMKAALDAFIQAREKGP